MLAHYPEKYSVKARATRKFAVIDVIAHAPDAFNAFKVYLNLNCNYCSEIVLKQLQARNCHIISTYSTVANVTTIQFCDFENIEWENVMNGSEVASSYLVRKGLSRKAQLSLQIKRFISKNGRFNSLASSFPLSIILETWNACEDMRLDFGGGMLASFDSSTMISVPFRQRLDWCLDDVKAEFEADERVGWHWILKPSVTNKGLDISIVNSWDGVLDALEATPDIREWVLQRYIDKPLLLSGHKFHLRVYVLCIGALRVYVFNKILVLIAARSYDLDNIADIYRHLTNTARAAENDDFDEERFVKLLNDLPEFLAQEHPHLAPTAGAAQAAAGAILHSVRAITSDLFRAFENEYTVFAPMSNCFELYGLDFMVDDALGVHLLEVNPGPDFKQTGNQLQRVIVDLFDQTCSLVLESPFFGLGRQMGQRGQGAGGDCNSATTDSSAGDSTASSSDSSGSSGSSSGASGGSEAAMSEEGDGDLDHTFIWSIDASAGTGTAGGADEVGIGIGIGSQQAKATAYAYGRTAPQLNAPDMTLVYRKRWSSSRLRGGMGFT